MRTLESDPLVVRFTPSRVPQTEEETRARLAAQIGREEELAPYGIWIAELVESGAFVGWFMLMQAGNGTLELGFMLVRNSWGRGLATEIGRTLVELAFADPSVCTLVARTDEDNLASQAVLAKLGFQRLDTVGGTVRFERKAVNGISRG